MTDGLSLVRKGLQDKGISDTAQEILMQSWRHGTKKQYRVYLQKWDFFAGRRDINPIQATVNHLLDFLTELHQDGLGYSGINTARSALSAAVTVEGWSGEAGKHPLVRRLVKAVFQIKPVFPRYQQTWDVDIVLSHLKTLHPPASLSLKQLTLKLVMLTALVTGQRGQSIHLMKLSDMTTNSNGYKFVLSDKVKQSAPGRLQPELMLPFFRTSPKLCVALVLQEYLKRTENLRNSDRLFVTINKPHQQTSRDTISRWIKTVMFAAGINVEKFAPHSTRAASTSKAVQSKVPLSTILRTAGWTNECTFAKFYKKPVQNAELFAQAVIIDS